MRWGMRMRQMLKGIVKFPILVIAFFIMIPLCMIWILQVLGGKSVSEDALHVRFWGWVCSI